MQLFIYNDYIYWFIHLIYLYALNAHEQQQLFAVLIVLYSYLFMEPKELREN